MNEKQLSRRDFLKGALAGSAVVALGSVAAMPAFAEEGIYKPGTYSATAEGIGTVKVTATDPEEASYTFTIPVEKYSPVSKDGKASVIGGAPEKATLPVPEIKQEEKDEEAPAVDKKDESKGASKEPANNEKKVN